MGKFIFFSKGWHVKLDNTLIVDFYTQTEKPLRHKLVTTKGVLN